MFNNVIYKYMWDVSINQVSKMHADFTNNSVNLQLMLIVGVLTSSPCESGNLLLPLLSLRASQS